MAKVAIHILTHNGLKYLPELFASISSQSLFVSPTLKSDLQIKVRIRDNHSTDGTREWLAQYASQFLPNAQLELSEKNNGFVGGHNELYKKIKDEKYVLLVNQDTVLEKDYIEKLVDHLDTYPTVASVSGLILRFDGKDDNRGSIDSAGITLKRNRYAKDRNAGDYIEKHHIKDYPPYEHVFGVSGTLPIYRITAVNSTLDVDSTSSVELFDEDFVMYKEDVDLAYRLQAQGHKASVVNYAIAYHDRTVGLDKPRARRTPQSRYNSYRNHMWMLIKNETSKTFWPDAPHIISHEIAKFFYLLLREPKTLLAWREIIGKAHKMRNKAKTT
ncbi:MAG: hypothetical protein CMI52_00380 [Parcubacteria group bacterium]|nr:hypothetical protein [Parcubacteria group bacterium]|tara:strand:+ start:308 stop:1294 length:987 start_codon:yes stop_codon:yes gene_type:complete